MKRSILTVLVLLVSLTLLFAQGAKEAGENEKLIQVEEIMPDGDHLDILGLLEDGTEIIYHTTNNTRFPLSVSSIKSGEFLIVKDTGIMTMSIPPQSTAAQIRNVTIAVNSGDIPFVASEKVQYPAQEMPSELSLTELNTEDLITMFNYSYGYYNATALLENGLTVNGAYFAKAILDSAKELDSPSLMSLEEMDNVLGQYVEEYMQNNLSSDIGKAVTSIDEINSLPDPSNIEESFAYSYGYLTTLELLTGGLDIIGEVYADGFLTRVYNIEPIITLEEMVDYINQYSELLNQRYEEYVAELSKTNAELAANYLEENGKREGVITLDSGVQLEIVSEDAELGATPTESDNVIVSYTLSLIDGSVIDGGNNVTFSLSSLIPGFVDACLNMKVGQTAIAYIPPELGYGENAPSEIGPNALLIFTIELVGIEEPEA